MPKPPFHDATQYAIGKIERAAYVTVTLHHIKDGDYWHAYANSDLGERTRTVASATADGEFACLDKLAMQLGVGRPEGLTAGVVAGAASPLDAVRESEAA